MSENVSKDSAPTPIEQQQQVPWKERFSYSLSDFACNLSFQMVGTYLMIFYTEYIRYQCSSCWDIILCCPVL